MTRSLYRDGDASPGRGKWAALLALVVAVVHAPLLFLHLRQQWPREHLQYSVLVPIAVAFMASRFVREPSELAPEAGWRVWSLFGLGSLLLAFAALARSPYASILALMFNSAGVIFACGGPPLFRALLPAWLCMLLMLPPPLGSDEELLAHLQRVTVRGCERIYEWGGGLCLVSGATIRMPGAEPLGVDRPCSGVNSLFATLACAAIALAWQRRGPLHAALVLAGAVGWVLLANIPRVLAVMLWNSPTLNLTKGFLHEALGFCTFAIALGLTLSFDRLLLFFNPRRIPDEEADFGDRPGWSALRARAAVAVPVASVLLAAGIAAVAAFVFFTRNGLPPLDYRFAANLDYKTALPAVIGSWRFDGYKLEKREGELAEGMASRSHLWRYRNGLWEATVALDYPYPGYHDLQPCYQNLGWTLTARDNGTVPPQYAPPAGDYVRLRMAKDDDHLFVAFAAFEDNFQPHPVGLWGQLLDVGAEKFWNDIKGRVTGKDTRLVKRVYQLQVVCQAPFQFTPDQSQQIEDLLFRCRQRLQQPVVSIGPFE